MGRYRIVCRGHSCDLLSQRTDDALGCRFRKEAWRQDTYSRFGDGKGSQGLHPFTSVVLVVTLGVYIFAPLISDILCGREFAACVPLIRIMTLVILFGEINYLVGIVGLINMDGQRYFFRSVMVTGMFSVVFMLLMTPLHGAAAAAWAMSLSEVLLFFLCVYSLYRISKHS